MYVGAVYTCKGTIVGNSNNGTVIAAYGNHLRRMNDGNVQAICINEQNLKYFPRNVAQFSPNLKVINLSDNSITSLLNSELKPHNKLEWLSISDNEISALESKIFDGSPNLKTVDFYNNNILFVGEDIKLPTIGHLNFLSNRCVDMYANTSEEIVTLKLHLLIECSHSPRISLIEETLVTINQDVQELKRNLQNN